MKTKAINLILIWAFLGMSFAWAAEQDALAPESGYRSERETVEAGQAEVRQDTLADGEVPADASASLPTPGHKAANLASKGWPFLLIPVILNVMSILSACSVFRPYQEEKKVVTQTVQEPKKDILGILQGLREGKVTIVGMLLGGSEEALGANEVLIDQAV